MDNHVTKENLTDFLNQYSESEVPGSQYVVVDVDETLFEYAGGWADIQNQTVMTLGTTMMAFSMTKTFTAVAILQLMEKGKLGLDDEIDRFLPDQPYRGHHITIRKLLNHTSGLPNPIPLRWVHLAEDQADFDEDEALAQVLRDNSEIATEPGLKFAYSNIGYWLLGKIVEEASGQSYSDYVRTHVLLPLAISPQKMDFVIPDPVRHANGYLAKYSLMDLIKRFLIDPRLWADYEDGWLRLKNIYVNGPAFGGLVGTSHGFSLFLQDQLRTESNLLGSEGSRLLVTQQEDSKGNSIPMTLGWHIGETNHTEYFFKEGGGAGFHSEMRLYPSKSVASVVMVNSTEFNSTKFLDRVDRAFLEPRQ